MQNCSSAANVSTSKVASCSIFLGLSPELDATQRGGPFPHFSPLQSVPRDVRKETGGWGGEESVFAHFVFLSLSLSYPFVFHSSASFGLAPQVGEAQFSVI